jgi:Spy/CpxP family protein refolding chaperone
MFGKRLGTALLLTAAAAGCLGARQAPAPDRQGFRRNIATLRLLRMTEILELSEEQTARIYPAFNKMERDKQAEQRTWSQRMLNLRSLVRDPKAPETDILAALKELRECRARIQAMDDELDALMERTLNPLQKAKYFLFQVDFVRGLGETLDRIRQRRNMPVPEAKK